MPTPIPTGLAVDTPYVPGSFPSVVRVSCEPVAGDSATGAIQYAFVESHLGSDANLGSNENNVSVIATRQAGQARIHAQFATRPESPYFVSYQVAAMPTGGNSSSYSAPATFNLPFPQAPAEPPANLTRHVRSLFSASLPAGASIIEYEVDGNASTISARPLWALPLGLHSVRARLVAINPDHPEFRSFGPWTPPLTFNLSDPLLSSEQVASGVLATLHADQQWREMHAAAMGEWSLALPTAFPGVGTLSIRERGSQAVLATIALQYDAQKNIVSKSIVETV